MLKNEKGITLIALVVTIVVLLILAAITITLAFNNNGIYNRAIEAQEATSNAVRYDKESITNMEHNLNQVLGNLYERQEAGSDQNPVTPTPGA